MNSTNDQYYQLIFLERHKLIRNKEFCKRCENFSMRLIKKDVDCIGIYGCVSHN